MARHYIIYGYKFSLKDLNKKYFAIGPESLTLIKNEVQSYLKTHTTEVATVVAFGLETGFYVGTITHRLETGSKLNREALVKALPQTTCKLLQKAWGAVKPMNESTNLEPDYYFV